MSKAKDDARYPELLKIIQFFNYVAFILCLFMGLMYLLVPEASFREIMQEEPTGRYLTALMYFVTTGIIGYVTYLFRHRKAQAVAYYIIGNFIAFGLFELITHTTNAPTSLFQDTASYMLEAAVVAYLLFSPAVKAYLNK